MKIQFWSVGKTHEPYVTSGVEEFTKRINNYFNSDWLIISPPKNAAKLSEIELKKAEALVILNQIQKEDYLILLDEKGKQISSPELAQWIQQRANASTRRIVFLIGGAFGVDKTLMQRADQIWSISHLVFPHMLVRLILSEQVYRACTILRNEKYHHN